MLLSCCLYCDSYVYCYCYCCCWCSCYCSSSSYYYSYCCCYYYCCCCYSSSCCTWCMIKDTKKQKPKTPITTFWTKDQGHKRFYSVLLLSLLVVLFFVGASDGCTCKVNSPSVFLFNCTLHAVCTMCTVHNFTRFTTQTEPGTNAELAFFVVPGGCVIVLRQLHSLPWAERCFRAT